MERAVRDAIDSLMDREPELKSMGELEFVTHVVDGVGSYLFGQKMRMDELEDEQGA